MHGWETTVLGMNVSVPVLVSLATDPWLTWTTKNTTCGKGLRHLLAGLFEVISLMSYLLLRGMSKMYLSPKCLTQPNPNRRQFCGIISNVFITQ